MSEMPNIGGICVVYTLSKHQARDYEGHFTTAYYYQLQKCNVRTPEKANVPIAVSTGLESIIDIAKNLCVPEIIRQQLSKISEMKAGQKIKVTYNHGLSI
jgi:hypothetical protein